jgi:hypothetical protein
MGKWFKKSKPSVEFKNITMFVEDGGQIVTHKTNVALYDSAKAVVVTPEQKKKVDRLFKAISREIENKDK